MERSKQDGAGSPTGRDLNTSVGMYKNDVSGYKTRNPLGFPRGLYVYQVIL